jgi:hypothetical protein
MLACPRPPNKSVLLEKFWNFVDFNRYELIGVDRERHVPDKRWLLDVLATYTPTDEIFNKNYCPPEKASKLSEIKTIEVPIDFMKDLPFSRRKSRRKGLRIQKEGLRVQKKERFKLMQKKFANAILDEEVKDDQRQSKKRLPTAHSVTNEGAFRTPQTPTTPPRASQSMSMSTSRMSDLNTSASSGGQPQSTSMLQSSPGMSGRMEAMNIDSGSKKRAKQ